MLVLLLLAAAAASARGAPERKWALCEAAPQEAQARKSAARLMRRKFARRAVDWTPVASVLNAAIAQQTFPGCVAIVGDRSGTLYAQAFGNCEQAAHRLLRLLRVPCAF
jgi:hypothetical protein